VVETIAVAGIALNAELYIPSVSSAESPGHIFHGGRADEIATSLNNALHELKLTSGE
jgi:hypothetical protein